MIERRFLENESQDEIKRLERNSLIIAIVAGIVAIVGSIASFIFEFSNPWTIFPISLASIVAIYLIRTGRFLTGNFFIIAVSFLSSLAEVLLRSGEGLNRGVIGLVFIGGYGLAAMPRSLRGRVLLLALFVASGLTVLDIVGPPGRSAGPEAPAQTLLSLITVLVFSFFIAREYPNLDLRAKISFGILITGGISVGVITYYSVRSSELLIDTLLERVEVSVNLLAEEQLINTVVGEASVLTSTANTAATQTSSLARQLELLQDEKTLLGEGTYWNAANNMIRLGQGQYSSDTFSPRSVFVPSTVEFNETVVRELNLNAYLDFSAPFILENSPQITAVYYTNTDSITTYYPNIRLGSSLPHDFDATTQPTFRVATPLFNPDKTTRWSFPRQDPVGEGLIISVSAPVYFKDQFKGVMTSDFKLDRVAEQINNIQVGATGYAFLIDKDGHIIAMPPAGYEFFELQPEILEVGEEPQQTIFIGNNSFEVQQFTNRMVSGGSGVIETNIQGVDTFVAFAPVADKEFSLGVIVPVAELTQPIIATQNEVNEQVEGAIRNTILILITLLAGAIVVSLGLGQLIATPLLRLTQTANQILDGDLSARARIESRDESGTLAEAFNAVTTQLGETLSGLEKTIEARTSELSVANQNNERRAKQFQSIAQVARTISSTLDFDSLLSQITTVISREFGFYHVGVFLLDIASEYAVLSAANSEGGQTMLARGHRLKVGEKGLVGFVSSTGRPRVALDTGADAVFFNNPDLPDTRSEIALPLLSGEIVIGVLDVQSTEPNAFSREDVDILSTLADQVSIAIQNARQNEQTQKALAESEALSRQFVQTGWSQFTRKEKILGIRHTGAKATILRAKGADAGSNQFKPKGRGAVLSIPIKLRGEVIGSVDVRAPDNRQWDKDEMDIVTAIIERAAIAMENARLLTESQKQAAKERAIGEISAKISAQSEVDDLLKTAAQELTRSLPGTEIAIQFRKEETE